MAALWNRVSLPPPTGKFREYNLEEWTFIADRVGKVFRDVMDDMTIIAPGAQLYLEMITFCRLVYRTTNFFRHDKQQRSCTRVRKCLNRFLAHNLRELMEDCCRHLNRRLGPPYSCSEVVILSKQRVQYVLVRLQGCSALICRTLVDLEAAFCHGHNNLRNALGAYFNGNLVLVSCCARLWVIFKALLLKCVEWYTSLNELVDDLKPAEEEWIPDLQLPKNLKEWLTTLSEENAKFLIPAKHARILDKGSEAKLLNKIFPSNKPTKELEEIAGTSTPEVKSKIDLGAVVSREEFEKEIITNDNDGDTTLLSTQDEDVLLIQETPLPPLTEKLEDIHNTLGLKKFVKEDIRRKKKKQDRYTSHLSPLQRKTFIKKCRALMAKPDVSRPTIQKKIAEWLHLDANGSDEKTRKRVVLKPKTKTVKELNGSNKPKK